MKISPRVERANISLGSKLASVTVLSLGIGCTAIPTSLNTPLPNVTLNDAQRCATLETSLNNYVGLPNGLSVKASYNAGGTQAPNPLWRPGSTSQGPNLPAHCVVSGVMDKRTGADNKPYETRFELRLPQAWSGRLLYQGGGGNDGVVNPATGRNTGSLGDYGSALSKGFAAVTTDAGHQGSGPEFGFEPQARIDKAYAAHDRVARTAKALIAGYYGQAVGKSYFLGCSGGGRQGMMFAQRYPDYFDGVISVAPAMSVASRATAAAAWDTQLFLKIAPPDAQGRPILSKAFSDSDLNLIASGINKACDAQDGLVDGMVNNTKACRFKLETLQCTGAKTNECIGKEQVQALSSAFAGPTNKQGDKIYATQPWDPGIAAPGWRGWKLGTAPDSQNNANNIRLMGGALGMVFSTPANAQLNTTNFDLEKDFGKFDTFSKQYDTFRDDKMNTYFNRGGKFMIIHGMADGIFSADESINYFERLAANHGGINAVQSKAKLFLVPGMNHCSGGSATDKFDAIDAMVNWVEKGVPPNRIEAQALPTHPQFPNRSRPLCPYPSYAKYAGQGSTEASSSFTCEASR
jgi:pimeloyl-ACP methyl ester carboxylesterase